MTREYLLKVIEKHFWVLSKEEIAKQIAKNRVSLYLPDYLVNMLQAQDEKLDNAPEFSKQLHPLFCEACHKITEQIEEMEKGNLTILGREKLFDDCLLFISIYYHYSAVLLPNVMADFLRQVLMKKILLT